MSTIENRSTLWDKFIKGLSAKLYDISSQVDMDYSLATVGSLWIQNNNGTWLFKTITSTDARITFGWISQIGDLVQTAEWANYASDSRISTYETQFDFVKYTSWIVITEEDRDDRVVDAKLSEARTLLVAWKRTMNKHMFDLFKKAFTAQASLPAHLGFYWDGVPFCSTLHPIKGTWGTQSNASATWLPLSEVNLETARVALMEQLWDKAWELLSFWTGNLILLVPPSLEKTAQIITNWVKRSWAANNDINIYDWIITVMSSKWLWAAWWGSDTAWYLIDSMFSPATLAVRRALNIWAPWIEPKNKNITIDISARYLVWNTDFRGVYWSKWAWAAYSS
jgi:hypothetical protein